MSESPNSYLLDTHVFLWWLFADRRLSKQARTIIDNTERSICVSVVSAFEIGTKVRLGKLDPAVTISRSFGETLKDAGFSSLSLDLAHASHAASMPARHRDPFDRMLAAQAEIEGLILLTRDPAFDDFPVRTLW